MSDTVKYGFEVYDFSEGANISDDKIKEWIETAERSMKESKHNFDFRKISCGNAVVISIKFEDKIETIISKNFVEKTTYLEETV